MRRRPDTGPRRTLWPFLVVGVAMMALAAIVIGIALQPATANRLGYALPRANGLPSQFSFDNMTYRAPDYCAGDAGCDPTRATRDTEASLRAKGLWPLKQVGLLPTLFGPNHRILEPVNDLSMEPSPYASHQTPFFLYIPDPTISGAYVMYMRGGGP